MRVHRITAAGSSRPATPTPISESKYPDLLSAHGAILRNVLANGLEVRLGESESVGANRSTLDLSNFQTVILDPTRRAFPETPSFRFHLDRALARFLWLASGNDRLSDIEIYDAGAVHYSDEGIRISGSNFGARLFCPRPGLNPIRRLIDLLMEEPTTRRASVPIFLPEDVGRRSKDIPCALGLHFRVTGGSLSMTVLMRSNNALRLFPYNGFEFSMLQEIIARHIGRTVGPYIHYALSMHLYSEDFEVARNHSSEASGKRDLTQFTPMPISPLPLEQVTIVARLETKFRNAFIKSGDMAPRTVLKMAANELCDYWHSYFLVLALTLSKKGGRHDLAAAIGERLTQLSIYPFNAEYDRK
jgi:thymidylate synthase